MTQTLHLLNSFCSVFTSIKTDSTFKNIQSAAFMLFTVFKRFTTTCVSSAKKSVSFFSTAAAGRAPPADESIHNCSRGRSGMCEFPYILMWSSQGQTFLCSLVFFIIIVLETQDATFNGTVQLRSSRNQNDTALLNKKCFWSGLVGNMD